MKTTELNKLLASIDKLPETMSQQSVNISNAQREAQNASHVRSRKSAVMLKVMEKQELRDKIAANTKRALSDPAIREQMHAKARATKRTPEGKARMKAAMEASHASEEYRAKAARAQVERMADPELRARVAITKMDPRTIDDCRTVFISGKQMSKELGRGKDGVRSPNLRRLTDEEKTAWVAAGMPRSWK